MNTEKFTGKAEVYAQARPSYANEAIDYIFSLAPKSAVFADIGAGTGKFSELIARRQNILYAVEPNDDMRLELAQTLSSYQNAHIVKGTGEDTGLAIGCIDVITVAQALHWFDPVAFLNEGLRILSPDGIVVALYNIDPSRTSPGHSKSSTDAFFGKPCIRDFPNPVYYTRENWISYCLSHSHDPKPGDAQYDAHIAKANDAFDKRQNNGVMMFNFVTRVYSSGGKRP
jgi:SAM-dependent methyltransferase